MRTRLHRLLQTRHSPQVIPFFFLFDLSISTQVLHELYLLVIHLPSLRCTLILHREQVFSVADAFELPRIRWDSETQRLLIECVLIIYSPFSLILFSTYYFLFVHFIHLHNYMYTLPRAFHRSLTPTPGHMFTTLGLT